MQTAVHNEESNVQVTLPINSRNITEAAQKRASEIVDRLGNDDLYEEEERDRETTVEDIIRSDHADEPTVNQLESSNREPEPVMPDESELVSEHVAVDPDLNELYLAKAKITEKLLLGDGMSDEEKNSNEENEDMEETEEISNRESTNEDTTKETNENIMNSEDHSNTDVEKELSNEQNTHGMSVNKNSEGRKVREIPSDSQIISDNQERSNNEYGVGEEYRKKQQSVSEEGEISDHTDDDINEEIKEKNDINEEITEDLNFLNHSTRENETTEESCSKRTKKKRKKRSRSRKGHRDRSSDKHVKRGSADSTDKKRRRQDVERGRRAEKEDKSKRIKEKFKAPLFVNTMRSTAEVSNTNKKTSQQTKDQSVKSHEKELISSGCIPKLNTDMLKKILANVSKGQQNQNTTEETSPTTSLYKVSATDEKLRADGTTSTSWNSGQEAREKNVGPAQFWAQSKGLSIPGAECQNETETVSSVQSPSKGLSIPGAECRNEREIFSVQSNVLPAASHLSSGASAAGTDSPVESSMFSKTWEKKRPSNSSMTTPPWEKRKRQKLEAQKVLATEEKQQVKVTPKNDEDGPTILFHGSGSQNNGSRDADNNSVQSLNRNAPWYKSSTNATSQSCVTKAQICEGQETREDSVSSIEKSESLAASRSLQPSCLKEDSSRPDGIQTVLLRPPWQNKATHSKKESVLSQPSPNELPPWRKGTSQIRDKKPHGSPPTHTTKLEQSRNNAEQLTAESGNRTPPPVFYQSNRRNSVEHQTTESNISEENLKTGLQQMSGRTSSTKSSVNTSPHSNGVSHQSKIDHRRNSVEQLTTGSNKSEENLKTGLQQMSGHTSATRSSVNRRRSSQMSEAASDTSSATSSSPRSHVGFSPGSSTSSASRRSDPERDQQIFEKRKKELLAEADKLLNKLKIEKTTEELRKFEEIKWKIKMVLLDLEINELIIHEKKEGNKHQVGPLLK